MDSHLNLNTNTNIISLVKASLLMVPVSRLSTMPIQKCTHLCGVCTMVFVSSRETFSHVGIFYARQEHPCRFLTRRWRLKKRKLRREFDIFLRCERDCINSPEESCLQRPSCVVEESWWYTPLQAPRIHLMEVCTEGIQIHLISFIDVQ